MENWKKYKLKELVELKSGYAFKGTDFISAGVPVVKIKNVKPGKIVLDNLSYVSREVANKTQNFRILPNDILITMSGNRIEGTPETWVGKVALFKHRGEFLLNQRVGILKVKDTNNISEVFLSLLLSSDGFQYHFISKATSSGGQANISPSLIYETDVTIPPIEEQKIIAKILSSLDNKIELNRRMNETLEAIARALFKAWFVDFEPVSANMENRPSQSASPEIAKLFPSEFNNDIPKGWTLGKLGDISFNFRENINPEGLDSETAYFGLEHLPRKSIALSDWGKSSKAESTKSCFQKGDILFGKLRPYFHKVGVAPIEGVCSTDILVIKPKHEKFFGLSLVHLSSDEIINYADRLSNGAKMPRIKWADLAKFEIVIPDEKLVEIFSKTISSIADKITTNVLESKELEKVRDLLLPRLMSGKIPVTELESKMEGGTE